MPSNDFKFLLIVAPYDPFDFIIQVITASVLTVGVLNSVNHNRPSVANVIVTAVSMVGGWFIGGYIARTFN